MTIDPDTLTAAARTWLGTPYHHGASVKGVGVDCLGLIRGVYAEIYGIEPAPTPAYTRHWAETTGEETLLDAADLHLARCADLTPRAGLVLAFRWRAHLPAKHLGLAVSATHMIHAVEGHAVAEIALSPWWVRRIAAVYAFPDRSL
jgi:NlpC/P60 family putative phage cell wall peptidase